MIGGLHSKPVSSRPQEERWSSEPARDEWNSGCMSIGLSVLSAAIRISAPISSAI